MALMGSLKCVLSFDGVPRMTDSDSYNRRNKRQQRSCRVLDSLNSAHLWGISWKAFYILFASFLVFFSPSVHRAAVTAHLELFSQDADTAGVCSGRLALLLTECYHVDGHIVIIIMTVVHLCVDGFCFLHQRELIWVFKKKKKKK